MRQGETAKLSQRLIEIAEPYLDCGEDVNEYRKEMALASTAWNLSLLPPDSREEYVKNLDLHTLAQEDRQLIAQHLRDLMQRKECLFPEDRRLVGSVDVLDEGDSFRVLAAGMSYSS
jgi:hypothetical protein